MTTFSTISLPGEFSTIKLPLRQSYALSHTKKQLVTVQQEWT